MKTLVQYLDAIDSVPFFVIPKGSHKGLDLNTLRPAPKETLYKKIRDSHKKFPVLDHTCVECKICGYRAKQLGMHIISHGMSVESYQSQYGDVVSQESKDRVKGENNPGYGHGGKFSAYSKNFVKYQDGSAGYSIDDVVRKSNKTKEENPERQPTRIEYYLSKGMTYEEARDALAARQATFSLATCVEKYGEEDGMKRWKERQLKWCETLGSKTLREQALINHKKTPFRQIVNEHGESEAIGGRFYIIEKRGLYKFGITIRTVERRYAGLGGYRVVLDVPFESIYTAFDIEYSMKRDPELDQYRIEPTDAIHGMGWTECLRADEETILAAFKKHSLLVEAKG